MQQLTFQYYSSNLYHLTIMSIGQLSKAADQKSRSNVKNTRNDSKFQSTKSLFYSSARVGDAVTVLADYDRLARSTSTSRTKLQKEWVGVSGLVLPFLSMAAKDISSSARVLAPMPDILILQTQGDSDLKRELACDPKYQHYTTMSEKLICHHCATSARMMTEIQTILQQSDFVWNHVLESMQQRIVFYPNLTRHLIRRKS